MAKSSSDEVILKVFMMKQNKKSLFASEYNSGLVQEASLK